MLVKGLKVKLGDKIILDNVTINLTNGINLIFGPNGSGKTTLLRTIIGMIKPLEGEILNEDKLSYSPSEFYSPSMKVIDVLLAGKKNGEYERFIKLLNLENLLQRDFLTLSSGEKRLIIIAKALAEGDLVIMDEPLSNLDIANRKKIIDVIISLKTERKFLITSHELDIINFADNVIVMKNGKVVYQGNKEGIDENLLSFVYEVPIKKINVNNYTFFITY
ncbi:ABC transporter ATP-binding protein [Sulfurisphaera ohwakuensis]|uniref:ATP-binding cassette domain-containing protein n=1 Tax=Sulfurisphaera ohwakuensis TaxID=69656 RepID=A0A650CFS2_SULOH|nr:ABC transporter ATP-binding protein [Sulfurisphaera ohwakuensis]MBB5254908.1 iron complex transport system ATP-binding protein [Sulfurisphaera ohwakuensis]QGR16586.1 ATP-binding cassette domain-containing protein [Sulfurisphaera ohwakuensis]